MIAPVKRLDQNCPLEVGDKVRRYVPRPGKRNKKMPQIGKILSIDESGRTCQVRLDRNYGGQVVTCRLDQIAYELQPAVLASRRRKIQAMWSEGERQRRIVRHGELDATPNRYAFPLVRVADMVAAFKGGAA